MRQARLRLALAADFDVADHEALTEFAHRIIDPTLPAEWEVGVVAVLWRRLGKVFGERVLAELQEPTVGS